MHAIRLHCNIIIAVDATVGGLNGAHNGCKGCLVV